MSDKEPQIRRIHSYPRVDNEGSLFTREAGRCSLATEEADAEWVYSRFGHAQSSFEWAV